jgi:superfamily II DNA/RNA helicase
MVGFIRANHAGQAGIIYTFSKKEADDVANGLCNNGIVARSYHSDVSETRKDQVQRSWMRNETQVVVATIAFGLVSTALFGRSTRLIDVHFHQHAHPWKNRSLFNRFYFIRESTNLM